MHNAKHSSSRSDQEHLEVSEPTQQNTTSGKCMILVVPRDSLGPVAGTGVAFQKDIPQTQSFAKVGIISALQTDWVCPGVA